MKVRFVGGPMGGQVKKLSVGYGQNDIVMRGPKKMTRQEKHAYMMENLGPFQPAGHTSAGFPVSAAKYGAMPMVEARYKLAMRPQTNGYNLSNMPCMHPDGSLFYEYVEGSKRDL